MSSTSSRSRISQRPSSNSEHDRRSQHRDSGREKEEDSAARVARIRSIREKHHPLLRAVWETDKTQANIPEKLRKLEDVIVRQNINPNDPCDILDEATGRPIAQATALIIACFEGDPDVIKFLLDVSADPNQTESEHHLTPIHVLCDAEYYGQNLRQRDRADLLKYMIRRGANVNHLDRSAMTALHKAVIHDRPECVEVLIDAKADPNVMYMGDTPLSIASRHNRKRICQILLRSPDIHTNHRNDRGGTPLHFAAAAIVDDPECVDILVSHGAKVNVTDMRNNTPTMVAAFFSKPKILAYLIKAGADLNVQNDEGKTAYEIAKERDFREVLDIISRYYKPKKDDRDRLADDMERLKIRK
ncbi:hypothetical protein ACOME3_000871 [Neoechinorhynchus agilis]